jgi:hypothetical protein
MKKFNETIKVEVSVDSIAQQLLNTMLPDFKHSELTVEAIIGSMLKSGTLTYVYNALNGYTNEINFTEGDFVMCSNKTYKYIKKAESEGFEEKYEQIGKCQIKAIELYSQNKLLITFTKTNRSGKEIVVEEWVSHKDCELIA